MEGRFAGLRCDVRFESHPLDTMTYKITRFYVDGHKETIKTGMTLEDAQAHCRQDDTHGYGWFDGYDEE